MEKLHGRTITGKFDDDIGGTLTSKLINDLGAPIGQAIKHANFKHSFELSIGIGRSAALISAWTLKWIYMLICNDKLMQYGDLERKSPKS